MSVDKDPARVTLSRVVEHIERLLEAAGPDHVGIGSDFDGFTEKYGVALRGSQEMPKITAALLERGHAEETVGRIMGRNWLRVIEAVAG